MMPRSAAYNSHCTNSCRERGRRFGTGSGYKLTRLSLFQKSFPAQNGTFSVPPNEDFVEIAPLFLLNPRPAERKICHLRSKIIFEIGSMPKKPAAKKAAKKPAKK